MSKTVLYVIGVIVLVAIAAGGGFFAGTAYGQTQAQSAVTDFQRQRAVNDTGAQGQAGGPCGFGQFRQGRQGGGQGAASGQSGQSGGGQGGQFGGQGGNFEQFGQCVARGQVKSIDLSTNTAQISTASSLVTVKLNDKTIVSKTDTGTVNDIKVGDRVLVFSRESGDNPTASAVQIQRTSAGFQP